MALQLPSTPVQKNRDGYLVVLFNKKEPQQRFDLRRRKGGYAASIVDDRGRLILGEGDGRLEESIDNIQTGQKRGSFEMNSAGGKAFVNYARMGSPEWTIISVTEMKQFREKAGAFKTVIIVCSLLPLLAPPWSPIGIRAVSSGHSAGWRINCAEAGRRGERLRRYRAGRRYASRSLSADQDRIFAAMVAAGQAERWRQSGDCARIMPA